jgi:hypothetical protein
LLELPEEAYKILISTSLIEFHVDKKNPPAITDYTTLGVLLY